MPLLLGVGRVYQEMFSLKTTTTTTLQASKIDVKQKLTNPGICLHWKRLMQKCFFFREVFFFFFFTDIM